MSGNKIRVFIVDDSKYMRYLLAKTIGEDPDFEITGEARDGIDALMKIKDARPDVVTLDVEMPRMDGLHTLKRLKEEYPVPVIMVSKYTEAGGDITIKALEAGAIDFVQKPAGKDSLTLNLVKEDLLQKLKIAATMKDRRFVREALPVHERSEHADRKAVLPAREMKKLVIIGSSTGGPRALAEVCRKIPHGLPAGFLIVQHMPPGFTNSLARRLNNISALNISEARRGDLITPGAALVAPGDYHLRIRKSGNVYLSSSAHVNNVRPAVDVTLKDAADVYADKVICVIMTGMGCDGAEGAGAVVKCGGKVFAQDEESCVVYGMPSAVIKAGYAERTIPLDRIAMELVSMI